MGKSKKRKPEPSQPRKSKPGGQFNHGLAVRRRAHMALADLKPAQMPLLLDALDSTATPVFEHLRPFGQAVPELAEFRKTRRIGPTLACWCQMTNVSAETLLVNRERYFCIGSSTTTPGAVDEQTLLALYTAYRCTSGAIQDRHAYYASEEMTALILAGSETSAEVSVTPADLPSPAGVVYLSHTGNPLLMLWQVLYDDLLSVQLVPAEGARSFIDHDGSLQIGYGNRFINNLYLPLPTAEALLSPVESDTTPSLREIGGYTPGMPAEAQKDVRKIYQGWASAEILEIFISFTHMLRQRTTEMRSSPGPGTSRGKRGWTSTNVTYLSYRSPAGKRPASDTPTRNYSSRWTVRGHWKRQWYPSEQRHHPMWISTYIAGPEGAPIKTSDKVTVL